MPATDKRKEPKRKENKLHRSAMELYVRRVMKRKQITLMSCYGYSQTETEGKQIGHGKLDTASHRGRAWKPKGTRLDDTRL
jgi:hypothetical protein